MLYDKSPFSRGYKRLLLQRYTMFLEKQRIADYYHKASCSVSKTILSLKLYPVIKPNSSYRMFVYREQNGVETPVFMDTFVNY